MANDELRSAKKVKNDRIIYAHTNHSMTISQYVQYASVLNTAHSVTLC